MTWRELNEVEAEKGGHEVGVSEGKRERRVNRLGRESRVIGSK